MSRDEEAQLTAEAEDAKSRLRRGLERSHQIVADYRKRLRRLRKAGDQTDPGNRPIFRWDR